MKKILIAALLSGVLFVGGWVVSSAVNNSNSSRNDAVHLTAQGELRTSLDILLFREFGNNMPSVKVSNNGIYNFNCANCGPLSRERPYVVLFRGSGLVSNLRLVKIKNPTSLYFGNYPIPLAIRGNLIQCGVIGKSREFLITYSESINFWLGCSTTEANI